MRLVCIVEAEKFIRIDFQTLECFKSKSKFRVLEISKHDFIAIFSHDFYRL